MTAHLPYLIAIGFAPVGMMLLLVIVTFLEGTVPYDKNPQGRRSLNG